MTEQTIDVSIEPGVRPGNWADWWRVSSTDDAFTIDFGVRQPYADDQVLIVVRVHLPWRAPVDLVRELEDAWRAFVSGRKT